MIHLDNGLQDDVVSLTLAVVGQAAAVIVGAGALLAALLA